jgi:hypothetical protein
MLDNFSGTCLDHILVLVKFGDPSPLRNSLWNLFFCKLVSFVNFIAPDA